MTASVLIETHPDGTKYTAITKHKYEGDRRTHKGMGFHDGWSKALDQLVEYVKSI